jgi:hypothetical protein
MKKHQMSQTEHITYDLIVLLFISFIAALIQTIFFQNRLSWIWSLVLWILAGIFLINGIHMLSMPFYFKKKASREFLHFNGYIIKGGLLSLGSYFCYYCVFRTGEEQTAEAIDPVSPKLMRKMKKGEQREIWVLPGRPDLCCMNKGTLAAVGIFQLAVGAGILLVSMLIVIS